MIEVGGSIGSLFLVWQLDSDYAVQLERTDFVHRSFSAPPKVCFFFLQAFLQCTVSQIIRGF